MIGLALCVCAPLVGQVEHNEVKRNQEPYYLTDGTLPNGRLVNHPALLPPGYDSVLPSDPGVGTSAKSWRWIPSAVNTRESTRQVTGFFTWMRPSAGHGGPFPYTGYIPGWILWGAAQRSDGGFEPDTNALLHAVPQVSFPFLTHDAYRACSTFSNAFAYDEDEVCFSLTWAGGEHTHAVDGQALLSSFGEYDFGLPTCGDISPAGAVSMRDSVASHALYTVLWSSYFESDPVINVGSDFSFTGYAAPGPLPFTGHGLSAGLNDVSTSERLFSFEVEAGPGYANHTVFMLFNLGPIATPSSWFGLDFELDVTSPLLGHLSAIHGVLDSQGHFGHTMQTLGPWGTFWVDSYVGMEFLVVSPALSLVDTTQAFYSRVVL